MSMKHWPASERPRERLLAQGAAALSDAELLALLLGSGSAGLSALDSARAALQQLGGVRALLTAGPARIAAQPGWGPAGYARLQAVLELGKRMLREDTRRAHPMESPQTVRSYLCMALAQPGHEIFAVLFLDAQNRLIACEEMFRGTLTQTSVYPREVVKQALHHNCAAVILAHNHPSGVAEPSRADEALTRGRCKVRWRWSMCGCSTTSSWPERAAFRSPNGGLL